jgi:hypothetical protein
MRTVIWHETDPVESISTPSQFVYFRTKWIGILEKLIVVQPKRPNCPFRCAAYVASPNFPSVTLEFGCPQLLVQYICNSTRCLEALPSILLTMRHVSVINDPLNMDFFNVHLLQSYRIFLDLVSCRFPDFPRPKYWNIININYTLRNIHKLSMNYFIIYVTGLRRFIGDATTSHLFYFNMLFFFFLAPGKKTSEALQLLRRKYSKKPSNPSEVFYRLCLGSC